MNHTAVEYIILASTAIDRCFAVSVTPIVEIRLARISYSTYQRCLRVAVLVKFYGHVEDH